MCEPLSTSLLIASLVTTAASTATAYAAQMHQADVQTALNANNNAAIIANRVSASQQIQGQEQLSQLTAYQKEDQQGRDTRSLAATSAVSAGESGVAGISVDDIQRQYFGTMGRYDADTQANETTDINRLQLQSQASSASAATQQSNLPQVQDPSLLGAGLSLAGGALGDYSKFGKVSTGSAASDSVGTYSEGYPS